MLIAAGGVPFSEALLVNMEDVLRQKPPASIGTNFVILFAYHSASSIPMKEGDALY